MYKEGMQAVSDIFTWWPTVSAFAQDIDRSPDTVRKWKKCGRIPQEAWEFVITAAAARGNQLTLADIVAANAPMKRRGRPPHQIRPRARSTDAGASRKEPR